ncbi:MAG: PleD family two-component system response regulator [Promethearchaeota archaeon]
MVFIKSDEKSLLEKKKEKLDESIIIEKTEEMIKYEKETGKFAIWKGEVTKGFIKWQKGEKIYEYGTDVRPRVTTTLDPKTRMMWNQFEEDFNYKTAKLIRDGVNLFIMVKLLLRDLGKDFSYKETKSFIKTTINSYLIDKERMNKELLHDIMDILNAIKGFTLMSIDDYPEKDSVEYMQKVMEQVTLLKDKIETHFQEPIKAIIGPKECDILVIDDYEPTIDFITKYFKKRSITIQSAHSAENAMLKLKNLTPKLILLDIGLPGIDGDEFCRNLKAKPLTRDIPVIFITAYTNNSTKSLLNETQAVDLIQKPFGKNDLDLVFKYLKK